MKIEPAVIKLQIDQLVAAFPEIAEDEILRGDMIEGSADFHSFLSSVERRRQESSVLANALSSYIGELGQRKARLERRESAVRILMFKLLEWANLKKVELPECTLSVRQGTPKVVIVDDTIIPDELCRIKREPDKAKIKEALEFGDVPGAALSNAEPTLAIRVK